MRAQAAIDEFRFDVRYRDTPVCIVAELEQTPLEDGDVRFVRCSPTHSGPLERASAERAIAAMVFARDPNDPRCDNETAVVVHALRRRNARARLSAELVAPDNREVLLAAGCDSIVDLHGFASALMTRSVSDVLSELLTNRQGSELYRVEVDGALVGLSWRQYAHAMLERGATAFGLVRSGRTLLSPALEERLCAGDEAFVVSVEPPSRESDGGSGQERAQDAVAAL